MAPLTQTQRRDKLISYDEIEELIAEQQADLAAQELLENTEEEE